MKKKKKKRGLRKGVNTWYKKQKRGKHGYFGGKK